MMPNLNNNKDINLYIYACGNMAVSNLNKIDRESKYRIR